jgi:hypothetical protein
MLNIALNQIKDEVIKDILRSNKSLTKLNLSNKYN